MAGILEGEGCFDYNRTPKYLRVRLEMTDADIVERVQGLVGGRLTTPRNRNPDRWRDSCLLVVNGEEAVALMQAVLPWMSRRRREKIESLLVARASVRGIC